MHVPVEYKLKICRHCSRDYFAFKGDHSRFCSSVCRALFHDRCAEVRREAGRRWRRDKIPG